MKLRIQDNSVRLRLTRSEVERLRDVGDVSGGATFPDNGVLRYVVRSVSEPRRVAARFEARGILVTIPEAEVRDWATSDRVSITGREALPGGDALDILVEKDFACLAPRPGEDDSDMFPHPREGEETC